MMSSAHPVEILYRQAREPLCRALTRRFPRVPVDLIAEQIQEAFITLWTQAAAVPDLRRRLHTIAWRRVRGLSRHDQTAERLLAMTSEASHPTEEEQLGRVCARRRLGCLRTLVPDAAVRFGGSHGPDLARALEARLTGLTDVAAARAYGVRREQVNRGLGWLREAERDGLASIRSRKAR